MVGPEPEIRAGAAAGQRLQSCRTEWPWSATAMKERRLALWQAASGTTTHEGGVLSLEDSGERKRGRHRAHIGRQYRGSVGQKDSGSGVGEAAVGPGGALLPRPRPPFTGILGHDLVPRPRPLPRTRGKKGGRHCGRRGLARGARSEGG